MPRMIPLANSYDAFLGPITAGEPIEVPHALAERWQATGFAQPAPEQEQPEEPEQTPKKPRAKPS